MLFFQVVAVVVGVGRGGCGGGGRVVVVGVCGGKVEEKREYNEEGI